MRLAAGLAALAAFAGAGVAAGPAQESPPTVTLTVDVQRLDVGATGQLQAGPTRFEVVNAGDRDIEISIAALPPGVTAEQAEAAVRRDPNEALELFHLVASAALIDGERRRVVTLALEPDTTYLVINSGARQPRNWRTAPLTVGADANAAALPRADATVTMIDLRFRGDTTLPRNGTIRFRNRGWAPHFAFAARLRARANAREVATALLLDDERALGRLLDFRATTEPSGLITRGGDFYADVRFPKAGRYVMVCFFEGHSTQGMYRFLRVR